VLEITSDLLQEIIHHIPMVLMPVAQPTGGRGPGPPTKLFVSQIAWILSAK